MKTFIFIFAIILLNSGSVLAQELDKISLDKWYQEGLEEIEALSLYPEPIREAILESTLQPGLLVKLNALQKSTGSAFNELIGNRPKDEQKQFWELTKYDGLIEKIVVGGAKNKSEISKILKDYPQKIHETALELSMSHFAVLEKINALSLQAQDKIDTIMAAYPTESQEAVSILLKYPEIIHLLSENLELCILVGEMYRQDPVMVNKIVDSIQSVVSRRYAEEVAAWEAGLAENPQALKEFEEISKEFIDVNEYSDYDPMYLGVDQPPLIEAEKEDELEEVVYVYQHYPFWFGYPYWYPMSYWYWYPYWYHWGYYYGPEGTFIIMGVPSYFFMSWYFWYPYHHYLYPHFSDYAIRHYQRSPGRDRTGFNTAIREWEGRNTSRVVSELITNDSRRVERLKEYGRFEQDYQRTLERRPNTAVDRDRYLQSNTRKYPNLSGGVRNTISPTDSRLERNIGQPSLPNRSYEINRARDLHQRTWERSNFNTQALPRTRTSTVPRSRQTPVSRSRSGG